MAPTAGSNSIDVRFDALGRVERPDAGTQVLDRLAFERRVVDERDVLEPQVQPRRDLADEIGLGLPADLPDRDGIHEFLRQDALDLIERVGAFLLQTHSRMPRAAQASPTLILNSLR